MAHTQEKIQEDQTFQEWKAQQQKMPIWELDSMPESLYQQLNFHRSRIAAAAAAAESFKRAILQLVKRDDDWNGEKKKTSERLEKSEANSRHTTGHDKKMIRQRNRTYYYTHETVGSGGVVYSVRL